MSSVALKFSSLVIRTVSKPIANYIKTQAREHERFRRICVSFAQNLHRVDMRLRLGLLNDSAALERQAAREAAEAQAKKHKHLVQTVKTEAETIAEEAALKNKPKEGEKLKEAEKPKPAPKPRIRPLSEAKAIDTGATFISETFLFLVGGGLILFESWRSRRKETSRREDVSDRLAELEEGERLSRRALVELENELLRLRAKEEKTALGKQVRILPRDVWELEAIEEKEDEDKGEGWMSKISAYLTKIKSGDVEDGSKSVESASGQPNGQKGSPDVLAKIRAHESKISEKKKQPDTPSKPTTPPLKVPPTASQQ